MGQESQIFITMFTFYTTFQLKYKSLHPLQVFSRIIHSFNMLQDPWGSAIFMAAKFLDFMVIVDPQLITPNLQANSLTTNSAFCIKWME